ncbi:MAG TPA: hypothetical protein VL053_07160 [Arachidicoccus sp.]|nr:hypothetical protein [Arachidicoccus sp.]
MKYAFILLLGVLIFNSCSNQNNFPPAENALVAAQQFLDGCMKGDFKRAGFYIQQDSVNEAQLKALEDAYYHNTSDQRVEYRTANIIIENDETVSPKEEIITYQNSYDKITRKLKAVQTEKGWKVDLKYTFSGNL